MRKFLGPRRIKFPSLVWGFHTIVPLILVLFFLPFGLTGGLYSSWIVIYEHLGLSWDGVFKRGEVWELVTHAFFHGTWLHVFTNAFVIFYFGGRLRDIFGEKQVWVTAAYSLALSGLFHLFIQAEYPLVGASGVGIGLLIALCTVSPESRMAPLPIRARNLKLGIVAATVFFLVLQLTIKYLRLSPELLPYSIGNACHLGGAIAGSISVRKYLKKPITLAQLQQERAVRESEMGNEAA